MLCATLHLLPLGPRTLFMTAARWFNIEIWTRQMKMICSHESFVEVLYFGMWVLSRWGSTHMGER